MPKTPTAPETPTEPRVLIIGATSAIAHAVSRRYAGRQARLYLLARNAAALEANAEDLRVRGAREVRTAVLDANRLDQHAATLEAAFGAYGGFDVALLAYGTLPDQARSQDDVAATLEAFDINARSVIALLVVLGAGFAAQGGGVLGVISSPAGERGRASNYVYGAAKAAVTQYVSGLRHRLHPVGVRVLTIVPGFVDSPMTAALAKGPLWATPDRVAGDIVRAFDVGFGVCYTPGYWRLIMALVRAVPERLFVKTQL